MLYDDDGLKPLDADGLVPLGDIALEALCASAGDADALLERLAVDLELDRLDDRLAALADSLDVAGGGLVELLDPEVGQITVEKVGDDRGRV